MSSKKTGRKRTPAFAIGHQFANAAVVAKADTARPDGYIREGYVMRCNCGREFTVTKTYMTKNPIAACRSCGSRRGAANRPAPKQSTNPLYRVWHSMLQRCGNPTAHAYCNYGARGIAVCTDWHTLDRFVRDMGPCPDGLTLERRDNDKGYGPDNCYWATPKEQNNNTRANRWLEFRGERVRLAEIARRLGTSPSTVRLRIDVYGWTVENACTIPVAPRKHKE